MADAFSARRAFSCSSTVSYTHLVPFLLQSSVDYFLVAELTLQNEKRMLHSATNRGFVMLNLLYPVNAGVGIGTLD